MTTDRKDDKPPVTAAEIEVAVEAINALAKDLEAGYGDRTGLALRELRGNNILAVTTPLTGIIKEAEAAIQNTNISPAEQKRHSQILKIASDAKARIKSMPPPTKEDNIVREFIGTEKIFLSSMEDLGKKAALLRNMKKINNKGNDAVLTHLEEISAAADKVRNFLGADGMVSIIKKDSAGKYSIDTTKYRDYLQAMDALVTLSMQFQSNPDYQKRLPDIAATAKKINVQTFPNLQALTDLPIMPSQRIPRHRLLLREMQKFVTNADTAMKMAEAFSTIKNSGGNYTSLPSDIQELIDLEFSDSTPSASEGKIEKIINTLKDMKFDRDDTPDVDADLRILAAGIDMPMNAEPSVNLQTQQPGISEKEFEKIRGLIQTEIGKYSSNKNTAHKAEQAELISIVKSWDFAQNKTPQDFGNNIKVLINTMQSQLNNIIANRGPLKDLDGRYALMIQRNINDLYYVLGSLGTKMSNSAISNTMNEMVTNTFNNYAANYPSPKVLAKIANDLVSKLNGNSDLNSIVTELTKAKEQIHDISKVRRVLMGAQGARLEGMINLALKTIDLTRGIQPPAAQKNNAAVNVELADNKPRKPGNR